MNCQEIKKNIKKLEKLKRNFQAEMEKIKKTGSSEKILDLKKEIEGLVSKLNEIFPKIIDIRESLKKGKYDILDLEKELGFDHQPRWKKRHLFREKWQVCYDKF